MKVKMEYELIVYVKPVHLNWTLEGIKTIMERYNANLWEIKIKRANHANAYKKKAHTVMCKVWVDNERVMPYIMRRLEKEVGVLV